MKSILILLSATFLVCSCAESVIEVEFSDDQSFFPLAVGQYRIFEVEEITFNLQGGDTSEFLLRETLIDSFPNAENGFTYLLQREKMIDNQWVIDSVWTTRRNEQRAVVTENNQSFVKLLFPVSDNLTWDGNILNGRIEETYEMLVVGNTTIGNNSFSNVIKVVHSDVPQNIVNQDERFELYADGIGLILKDYITLGFCTSNCEDIGVGAIESGRILNQVLVEYGDID